MPMECNVTSETPDSPLQFSRPDDGDDAPLRSAYQAATRTDRRECPGAEELSRLVTGELEEGVREAAVLHLAGCADCSRELRALRQAEGAEPRETSMAARGGEFPRIAEANQPHHRRPWRNRATWLAAAAAALLISVPLWRAQSPATDPGLVRGGDVDAAATPQGTITATPAILRWPNQPGATAYVPKLYTAAADPIWTGPATAETEVALPDEVARRLEAAGEASFVWTVEVRGAAARTELGPYWFHLRSPDGASPAAPSRDG